MTVWLASVGAVETGASVEMSGIGDEEAELVAGDKAQPTRNRQESVSRGNFGVFMALF